MNRSTWPQINQIMSDQQLAVNQPNIDFDAAESVLLVSQPARGRVWILRPSPSAPVQSIFVQGLKNPHDLVFHVLDGVTWLYVSESNQISRYRYNYGDTVAGTREIVVAGLPDASSPELGGSYGHQLKNIALAGNTLYVAIASATNASPSDANANPVRCAVYRYDANGANGRLLARGLRNAEGLTILPGTSELWVTVNQRDEIRYPHNDGTQYNGRPAYGQIVPAYRDNHPPEAFTEVVNGANYGWPFANPNPDGRLDFPPFDPDHDNNRDWNLYPPSTFTRISKALQAHSAPLGYILVVPLTWPLTPRGRCTCPTTRQAPFCDLLVCRRRRPRF